MRVYSVYIVGTFRDGYVGRELYLIKKNAPVAKELLLLLGGNL
jgi:hypothetical protein